MKALVVAAAALTVIAAGMRWSVGDAVAVATWWLIVNLARLAVLEIRAQAAATR